MMTRGALIILEGCDRAGKSTQVKRLVEALNDRGIPALKQSFPDRETKIGGIIAQFLTKEIELEPEAAHLLFSANRWELSEKVTKLLHAGTTLVVDRYAASGAAYAAASTGRTLAWCKTPDSGLPAPDFVAFLELDSDALSTRNGWAEERFERKEFQVKVAENFTQLKENTWHTFQGNQNPDIIHQTLLDKVVKIINDVQDKNIPIKRLYENIEN